MTAVELIEHLSKIVENYGDLEVKLGIDEDDATQAVYCSQGETTDQPFIWVI